MGKIKEEYTARQEALNNSSNFLTEEQQQAIAFTYSTLATAMISLTELFDLDMSDARSITEARYKLSSSFPRITKERCDILSH